MRHPKYTLYDYLPSGNGYKVRLTAKHLDIPYRLVELDLLKGATRQPQFLSKNPNGRIPLLEIEGRGFLWESHAIISFLADGSELVPADPWQRAQLWQWLCFEQYNLEPNVATVRWWTKIQKKTAQELGERLIEKLAKGYEALGVLEKGLADNEFLLGNRFTLADISLFAYTHVAPEGGMSLEAYPQIRAWIKRVAAQPRHAPITAA
jgi:glutathione S-transferase